jgi:hypothetical protein
MPHKSTSAFTRLIEGAAVGAIAMWRYRQTLD